ncbi:isoprenylcysteine carboxylmethyltransferase family protein [Longimicrobium sp.]|uniref:methyltransferase family protein n=1 Tax=Longimicrobium sp. TaxID=2029185 RepID=UPI002C294651|nr:isoprenylcysteine carboxylmethyltransferase family protein [Longimicrobium sp.]HSU16119.1 isoprenylcysteine carboxylmethyltransferase family protein [Longimicrobium sp.]
MDLLKTLLFTILVPGTVAGYVPAWLRRGEAAEAAPPAWRVAAGVLVFAVGAAVYLRCAWDFATAGRGTPSPTHPPRALVARGLYRWSRNPMYVGVVMVVLGQALGFASRADAVYGALLWAAFHLRVVLVEEPVLRRSFGAAYEGYVARVPRWFGRARPAPEPFRIP